MGSVKTFSDFLKIFLIAPLSAKQYKPKGFVLAISWPVLAWNIAPSLECLHFAKTDQYTYLTVPIANISNAKLIFLKNWYLITKVSNVKPTHLQYKSWLQIFPCKVNIAAIMMFPYTCTCFQCKTNISVIATFHCEYFEFKVNI